MRKTTKNVTDMQPSVLQLGHFKNKGDPLSATNVEKILEV
jgi:hypothetical protein